MRNPETRTFTRRGRRMAAPALLAALLLSACGGAESIDATSAAGGSADTTVHEATTTTPAEPDPSEAVSFVVADYLVDVPSEPVRPGVVTLELVNNGQDFHHLQLWRVDDGPSAAAALEAGDLGVLASADAVGGVGAIEGGGTRGRLSTELEAGEYVAFCLIHTAAGAHNELGMVATFEVDGAASVIAPATAAATLTITPYGFDLPGDWDGEAPLRVVNATEVPADAEFLRLAPGKSRDDFFAFIDGGIGPPPFTVAGGVSGLGGNHTAVLLDDLEPGEYLVASFQPDPAREMVPQFLTGFLTSMTVS